MEWTHTMLNYDKQSGQALVLAIVVLSMGTTLFLALFNISMAVKEKIHLQSSADLAVLTALNIQANALNALAMGNRAILSNEAMAAQANALVSEAAFYRKLIEGFGRILKAVPSTGPILGELLIKGGQALETLARRGAGVLTPYAWTCNALLETERELIRKTLPLVSLKKAVEITAANAPRASISFPAQVQLANQAYNLGKAISPLSEEEMRRILHRTLDPRTLRRNWSFGAGSLPFSVRKRGGSSIPADDFYAWDRLSIQTLKRFRLRWKTVVDTSSRASAFGYRSHKKLMDLNGEDLHLGLTLVLQSNLPPVSSGLTGTKRTFIALSSGELYYRRPDKPSERPNLLNPFWRSRLIPVSSEKTAGRIIPHLFLKEIKH